MESRFSPDVTELTKRLEELEKSLNGERDKISAKKKKDIEQDLDKLFLALRDLKKNILLQASIPIDVSEFTNEKKIVESLIQSVFNFTEKGLEEKKLRRDIEESQLPGLEVYAASADLTKALLNDRPFDHNTIEDVRLLTNTLTSLNNAMQNPKDTRHSEALLANINKVGEKANNPNDRHTTKWRVLGLSVMVLALVVVGAAVAAGVILSGGAALPAIIGVIGGIYLCSSAVGAAASLSHADTLDVSRKNVHEKTANLHSHLSTFHGAHKKRHHKEPDDHHSKDDSSLKNK